jgi:hypothetical protein
VISNQGTLLGVSIEPPVERKPVASAF